MHRSVLPRESFGYPDESVGCPLPPTAGACVASSWSQSSTCFLMSSPRAFLQLHRRASPDALKGVTGGITGGGPGAPKGFTKGVTGETEGASRGSAEQSRSERGLGVAKGSTEDFLWGKLGLCGGGGEHLPVGAVGLCGKLGLWGASMDIVPDPHQARPPQENLQASFGIGVFR